MRIDWRDLALRAAHTFWQFFTVAFGGLYAASGAHVSQISDVSSAKRFALALLGAIGGAALVALRLTVKAAIAGFKNRGSWTPDQIAAAFAELALSPANVDTPQLTPSDPGQPAAGVPPTLPATGPAPQDRTVH